MILWVGLSAILYAATAAPSRPIVVPDVVHAAPAAVAVVTSQSHAQDELGQYSYSYSNPLSAKVETKTVDGITRGGYSYLDSHGLVQNVNYVSDDVNGFRVAASNLPLGRVTPQEDEPLVAHEKAKAVAALHQAAVLEAAEAAVVHANDVVPEPVHLVAPSGPGAVAHAPAYVAEVDSTPAPPLVALPPVTPAPEVRPVAYAAEVHSTPAPVLVAQHPAAPAVLEHRTAYLAEVHSTPAPEVRPVAYAAEVHPTPAPVLVSQHPAAPAVLEHRTAYLAEAHSTPAPPLVAHPATALSPVAHSATYLAEVHSTPAPALVAHPTFAPSVAHPAHYIADVRSTPAPALVAHSPSATPVVHVTPVPFRPTPTVLSVPAEHAHSYATVELDAHDIPAPSPSPGAYFQPSHIAVVPSPAPVPVSTPAPIIVAEPAPADIKVAAPVEPVAPVAYVNPEPAVSVVAAPAPVVVTSQSHAQDELGQYSYSYSNPLSAKVETKTVDGITRGGYSYLDSHGLVQNVNYVSDDHNGFRVAASNLPSAAVPVDIPDSDDVAAAKAVFFAEIAKAKAAVEHAH